MERMNGIPQSLVTFGDVKEDARTIDGCRRLTLQDQDQSDHRPPEHHNSKSSPPDSRALAPSRPISEETPPTVNLTTPSEETVDLTTPSEETVEIIKVYLESRQREAKHQHSLNMLTDEVSQIQEVRYCLKTLREQMAARENNNNNKFPANGYRVLGPANQPIVTNRNQIVGTETETNGQEESTRLREVTKRLYGQLKESERRHQEEKNRLQVESSEFCRRLDDQSERLQRAEGEAEKRGRRVEELQRLLGGMELEGATLRDKMATGEAELLHLREMKGEGPEMEQRTEELEKQVAILKEKIHHLDDMLKSQQRKVRHMIEQLQNSRTVIQERDRVIRELQEKVDFLEAENKEMHDQMEFFTGQKHVSQTATDHKAQIIYSKPLSPLHGNKSFPFIKVIETKS